MPHTVESLHGVFNPDLEGSSQRRVQGRQQHQRRETPRESVARVQGEARAAILGAAGLLEGSEQGPQEEEEEEAPSSEAAERRVRSRRRANVEEEEEPEPGRRVPGGSSRCFLCDYCTSPEVRFVITFIADNIANMEVGLMAEQIRKYIFEKRPEFSGEEGHGLEVAAIRRHIRHHMLSPTVRIADMMRHLLSLCDTLRGNLERVDPDTGESSADRGNIDTYLKVVTKVLDMYKMSETSKMLFTNAER